MKSVKPPTSNSQKGHIERANSPLKPNAPCKTIPGLIFEKSTFEVGENSKTKQVVKSTSLFQNSFSTCVKPSSNSKFVPLTDKRKKEGETDVKRKNHQKESLK